MQRINAILLVLISLSLLNACSQLSFPGVYKIDINQGNVVTQDLLDKLKPQMTQSQVKYILGAPLVTDTFNANQWDYFYSLKKGRTGEYKQSRLTVYFEKNLYTHHKLEGEIRESSVRREPLKPRPKRKKFLGLF